MSGKRAMQRKRSSAGKSKTSSPIKVAGGTSGYFEEEGGEPLEFGVIEVKSEVEEIVLTSQIGDIASLVEASVNQDGRMVVAGSSLAVVPHEVCYVTEDSVDNRYSCSLCVKQFGRQAALKKHLESHRQDSGKRRARTHGSPITNSVSSSSWDSSERTTGVKVSPVHKCESCEKIFLSEQSLKEHALTHSPAKTHFCLICSKSFASRSHLSEHIRVHTGEKPYICSICNHGFASPSNLRKHLRFHKRRMPYVCSFCLQSYPTDDLLDAHLLIHKGFVCPECKEVLGSRADLEHHRLKHGVQGDLKCTSCGQGFVNRRELLAHLDTHVEPDVFVCSECKANFRYPSVLRQHMTEHTNRTASSPSEPMNICLSENVIDDLVRSKRAVVNNRQLNTVIIQNNNTAVVDAQHRLYQLKNENDDTNQPASDEIKNPGAENDAEDMIDCDLCPENFVTVTDLVNHKLASHGKPSLDTKKPDVSSNNRSRFICLYCSKPFTKRYCLEQHERVHSGERPFSCETCGLTFKQQSQLLKHNMRHTGLKPFVCNYCKKAFSQASYLTEHKRQHTNERPYGCDVCGNRFRTNGALRVHNRQHTGAMPYMCEVCNRRFKQKANLQKHIQIHTNIRSHNCEICGKGFTDSQALKRHMVMHTGDRPYVCQLCGKTFPAQSSLTIHMKFHRGERKHRCHLCEKAFVVKSHLNRHLNTHGKRDDCAIFVQESVASNYIPIDDDFIIADSFQVEEVVLTS